MLRDKQATRARILAAVGEVLARDGFAALGVSSVAKEAGIDKVLIYRYFGSFEHLLKTFAEENPALTSLPPLLWPPREKALSPAATTVALLRDQLEELRRRQITQETLRWELHDANVLTEQCAAAREKMVKEYLSRLAFDQEKHPDADLGAVFALLHAGITHLVASASKLDFYQTIDLKSARGWKRVDRAFEDLIIAYFKQHEEPSVRP